MKSTEFDQLFETGESILKSLDLSTARKLHDRVETATSRPMKPEEIELLIDSKIRNHEVRVALISGIVGGSVVAGIFHAIRISYVAATG